MAVKVTRAKRVAKRRVNKPVVSTAAEQKSAERPPGAALSQQERRRVDRSLAVPLTLGDICDAIGHDVKADSFAPTAFMELANQLEVVAEAAESTEFHGYEAWTFTQNILERMRLAGRVSAWLAQGATAKELPEVQP